MMRPGTTIRKRRKEAGIALLIAIFILLLIGVVAIALVVSSGTESALAGNYRASSDVYYAAVAGVEEVRARLRPNVANFSFNKTSPGFLPAPGTALSPCAPVYVRNPLGGEAVVPWDSANAYYDTEFNKEFGASCPGPWPPNPSPITGSVWSQPPLNGLAFPGPLYKWVRINGVSEKSLNLDVDGDGLADSTAPLYYTGNAFSNNFNAGPQALEVTALAVLPSNSQNSTLKLVQYLVVSNTITFPGFPGNLLSLPSAVTIAGNSTNGVAFSAPAANNNYYASGADLTPTCGSGPVHAIGVFDDPDKNNVISGGNGGAGIPAGMQSKYAGANPAPDVVDLIGQGLVPSNLQSPAQVDLIAQTVIQNADVIIPSGVVTAPLPTITGSQLSAATPGMTSSNPMTVVVNGNLDLTSWHNTGYGLLLVTGNLNYDPDALWQGLVLVIGQGTVTGSMGGTGEIDGEVFVAKTRDPSLNLLSSLGKASILFGNNLGGNGIRYSSCWVQKAQPVSGYKILSFHEVSQ